MPSVTSVCLFIISSFHLGAGIGSLFKIGPDAFTKPWWMVNGKPGTGDTPIEKLFGLVLGLWYTASIMGVLIAYFAASTPVVQGALLCLFIYHVALSISMLLLFEEYKILDTDKNSVGGAASMHVCLAIMIAAVNWGL